MADLIVGYGEIGKAVKETISPGAQMFDLNIKNNHSLDSKDVDVMHVCFPYSLDFVENVQEYIAKFQPHHIVIYSTVPIGTTKQINEWAVHSPVEGKHPDLALSLRQMERWVGYNDENQKLFFNDYFLKRNLKTKLVENTDFTEFIKIRSTSKYGINLIWTDFEKSIADDIGMDFGLLKDYDVAYNRLYKELGEDWAQRYILDPPEGKLGGHCVKENSILLSETYSHPLLDMINAMRKP